MYDGRVLEAMPGARNLALAAGVKEGESVLFLMSNSSDLRLAQAVGAACREVGAKTHLLIVEDTAGLVSGVFGDNSRNVQASPVVREAAANADVLFNNTRGLDIGNVRAKGARSVGLFTKDIDGLISPGARLHPEVIFKIVEVTQRQWRNAKTVTVTTDYGTKLTATVTKPNHVFGHITQTLKSGKFFNYAGGFGAVCMWPDWTANGDVAFDAVCNFNERTRKPLKWTVREGRVVKVEGDPEHVEFINSYVAKNGPDANHFGEIMFGCNPLSRIGFTSMYNGIHMETERHAGVMHCAVGSSTDMEDEHGNQKTVSVRPAMHFDCMTLRPTIRVDDELSIENGRLKTLDDPAVQEVAKKYGLTL